jgi:hypothetical protein
LMTGKPVTSWLFMVGRLRTRRVRRTMVFQHPAAFAAVAEVAADYHAGLTTNRRGRSVDWERTP